MKYMMKKNENGFGNNKKITAKNDLAMYLGQFFNFDEDINECFRIAGKKAC